MTALADVMQPTAYRPALGLNYLDYLNVVHQLHVFDWYLEVGCRAGNSFAPVRSRTIAVDPYFAVSTNVIGAKPSLFVFQETSDAFFASGFLKRNDIQLGFSFLDGMHHFEFLLRDIINTERASHPDGVIALHDCCPLWSQMTVRDYSLLPPNAAWTGDVWKLIPILQEYRPEMRIDVLDCQPTGLVLLSNLTPGDTRLSEAYDEILARYMAVEIESFGVAKFFDSFAYVGAIAHLLEGQGLFKGVSSRSEAPVPGWVSP